MSNNPSESSEPPHHMAPINRWAARRELTDEQMIKLGELVDSHPELWDSTGFLGVEYYRAAKANGVWDEIAEILMGTPCFANFKESINGEWTKHTYRAAMDATTKAIRYRLDKGECTPDGVFRLPTEMAFKRHLLCAMAARGHLDIADYPLDDGTTLTFPPAAESSNNGDTGSTTNEPSLSSRKVYPRKPKPSRVPKESPQVKRRRSSWSKSSSPTPPQDDTPEPQVQRHVSNTMRNGNGTNRADDEPMADERACDAFGNFISETLKTMPSSSYLNVRRSIYKIVQDEEIRLHVAKYNQDSE